MISYGFRSYLATLFAYLVIRSDLLLVTALLGTTETGIYSVAAFAVDALYLFSATTGSIFFPIATAQPAQRDLLTAKIVRILGLIMVGILLLGGLVGWYFIPLLYGEAYAGAVAPTLILLPGIFFLSLETIFMNNFAGRGLPVQAILVIVAGFFVNLILNLLFIPLFGINGAAIASTIAYGSMFIGALIYFMRLSQLSWQEILIPRQSDFLDMMTQIRHQVKKDARAE
jgi:O-antigen/teichoic acid export membrane protein